MLIFTINSTNYKIFQQWDEMPMSMAVDVHSLCVKEMPQKLKDIYTVIAGPGESEEKQKTLTEWYASVTDEEEIKLFPAFYGKIISLLASVPSEDMEKVSGGQRTAFYKSNCEKFVFGIMYVPTDFQEEGIKSFKHKDLPELFLPVTKEVMGVQKPFFDRTAIEFTESADLELYAKSLSGGKYEVAANIVSVLCRPRVETPIPPPQYKGRKPTRKEIQERMKVIIKCRDTITIEKYNEETCLERAKQLADLPMNIVFEVFFCLGKHTYLFSQLTLISFQEVMQKEEKQLRKAV